MSQRNPNAGAATAFDTDVLVVGSGPMGATTALALATYGVKVHMVSRWNWLADTPRAHITNQRAMEVYRDLQIEEEAHRYATPWELMGDCLFTTSLAGEELVRLRSWGTGDARKSDYLQGSPCPLVDLIQPNIEPILFKSAAERGATFATNTEYQAYVQDEQGVTVSLKDRLTGREYTLRAKYLVGADGARSQVAQDIGLPISGEMARAGTLYTLFNADLSAYVAHRPSILHWIVSPDASFGEIGLGLLRAVKPWTQWIAGWGFDISKGDPDQSDETVLRKIRVLVGDPKLDVEIVRKSVWYVNQAYATEYSRGRVFCGGDAVHRHPPSSGLGLNTCVQDAFNLAWKLAFVLKGYAGEALLESYSDERAPVGKQIVERANQSRLDYAPIRQVFSVEGAENPVAAGIARFKDPGAAGAQARKDVQAALELKNREFNAQGVEMNQRYASAAVMADDDARPEPWLRDPELYLQATTRPGAKLPHAWLIDARGRRISTLDVVGRGQFTLVTGLSGQAWVEAAEQLARPCLRTVVIGERENQDPWCDWQRLREIEEDGVLLVRPDGYVAWRQHSGASSVTDARRLLERALSRVLNIGA
ncbi:FAD-dependent oxidoreductase [Paraburkholderia unamae]|uniref:2,4-dichlorophenol 6-monooxygenase n=1 Tax=Paraburkholderia unamae TaxID=219649 RepID=A0ABX5K8H1_9BURK|nr:FAD-dependent monooxygenase [Paraburkholderia unamae]PVX70832.1 2,4-dichlorophenol 6-monooxygenase [Paraburkholderia unamae]CAG9246765.1 2,4-dichlorophenol 6-monooxygenase [Paraburkholderia unamae]